MDSTKGFYTLRPCLGCLKPTAGRKKGWSQQHKLMLPFDPTQLGKFVMTGWNSLQKTTSSSGGSSQKHKLWLSGTSLVKNHIRIILASVHH